MPHAATRNAARAYLALSLGAGIDGYQLSFVMPGDIREDEQTGAVTVGIRADRDTVLRRNPVLAPFAPLLLELRGLAGDRPLLRGRIDSTNIKNRPSHLADALARRDPHAVRADSTRLRATWLAVHLACGTPLPQLLTYAGLTTIYPLETFLPYIPTAHRESSHPWAGLTFDGDVVL